jgi:hypothetical protein
LTHHTDGLSTCKFAVLGQRPLNRSVTVYTVDLQAALDPAATTSLDGARIEFTDANVNGYLRRVLPPGIAFPESTISGSAAAVHGARTSLT